MKIFILECTEDELRANRGIMDAIVDACQGVVDAFYGSFSAASSNGLGDEESQEKEDGDNEPKARMPLHTPYEPQERSDKE